MIALGGFASGLAGVGFAQPWWLLLGIAVTAAGLFARQRARRAAAVRSSVFGPRAPALTVGGAAARPALRRACGALACFAVVLALAGPRWGAPAAPVTPQRLDLLVCLDVSRSMLARDVAPSRLQLARSMLVQLAARARGDRLGLVAFAGEARLCVPLTTDGASFAQLVAATDELSVARGGTDLGRALDTALAALVGRSGGTVLLLTDGEDHGGAGIAAAQRCASSGVTVHCVGFGSERGGKIPLAGAGGETFLRDAAGRDVVTALDRASLAAIAAAGGGEYVDASSAGERALVDLYERAILPAARGRAEAGGELVPAERFQWPLALALVLGALQWWLGRWPAAARRVT